MQTKIFSFILFGLICLCESAFSQTKLVNILIDDKPSQRRYYDSEKKLRSEVFLNTGKSKSIPGDSTSFSYNQHGELTTINSFHYDGKSYAKLEDPGTRKYYDQIFTSMENCDSLFSLAYSNLFDVELSDICTIQKSLLTDGREVDSFKKNYRKDQSVVWEFDNLYTRFENLSLDLQKYFYDRQLIKLIIHTKSNYIMEEEYFFDNGHLKRTYFYHDKKPDHIFVEAVYNNGSKSHHKKSFVYN